MDGRNNTIAGWALFAGIIALGATVVTGEIFHGERPEKMGYPIEGADTGTVEVAAKPVAFYLATADAGRGEQVFARCSACHNVTPGGANALGPALYGVMGNDIASHAGFAFSDALASKEGTWTWEEMDAWLASPKSYAPGTKMTFAGLSDPQARADLLLYMNQQDSSPLAVPPPPAEEEPAPEGDEVGPAEDVEILDEATTDADGGSSDGGQEVPEA